MKLTDFFMIAGWIACCATVCLGKRGFILTAPKAVDAGSTEYFTFTAFDVPSGGAVSLKLLNWYTDSVLAESGISVLSNMNQWIEMSIPPLPAIMKAKLLIQGNFSDGYRINAEKEVHIRHNSVLTFVQTDKPIYKPGQTVKFRILPLNNQLRPLKSDTVGDVWIEDPSGIRVAHWRQILFKEGMMQLEVPLSHEPPLGTWSIKTVINEVSATQNFNVEKYVLPKFEVKIKPPPVIMIDADTIPFQICAQYSYGKKVDGKLKVKLTYKQLYAQEDLTRIPSVEHAGLISGCYTFVVNTRDILFVQGSVATRELKVMAEVIENGTDIKANATVYKQVATVPLTIQFLGTQETEYFKPGIPYIGQLQVLKRDGEVATSEKIQICAVRKYLQSSRAEEKVCHTFTSNKKGRVKFSLAPQTSAVTKLILTAEAAKFRPPKFTFYNFYGHITAPSATMRLNAWYSPSSNYLQIQAMPDEMQCEQPHRVRVRYTAERGASIKFFHKVISRGRLVQQGSHQRTFYPKEESAERRFDFEFESTRLRELPIWLQRTAASSSAVNESSKAEIGQFELSFDPRATMSPVARLLIYYVRPNGEVVADSRKFRITTCLLNKVHLHFRHEQQYPSTEASLMLSASPSSICGIGMVDKSVRFLSPENQFQIEKVFEIIEKYDLSKTSKPSQVTTDYCMLKNQTNTGPTVASPLFNQTLDPLPVAPPAFSSFNHFLTRQESQHVDTSMAFEEAGMVVVTDYQLETRPCVQRQPVASARIPIRGGRPYSLARTSALPGIPENMSTKQDMNAKIETVTEEIRSFFPETWLWEMHTLSSNGEMALRRKLPHTITQWVGRAVCIHPKAGLGISEETSITAFQPFFVSFRLPYSVVRGEVLPLVVTVFNYLSECLPIKVSVEPSADYVILSDARSHKMCVCGSESASHKFSLQPTILGHVNVTVYGYSMEDDDAVCGNEITARLFARDALSKELKVEAEGFPKEDVYNYYICPKNTNGSYATEIDLIPPDDVVEGSARAFVSISGDLMAPALSGLHNLVQLPKGCGEQNMVLFTPNIYVLDYLVATQRLTLEVQEECLSNMKTGYQRELLYRHKDGAYSAFGPRDKEGSLWLTAFVLKSLGQARRFIEVDEHDLILSSNWILQNQFENGCFQPVGFVYHKEMKGGLSESEHSLAPMTAYVLIALIQSGVVLPDQKEVHSALQCLEEDVSTNLYALSLFAYASALAKQENLAKKFLLFLDYSAIHRGGATYWDSGSLGQRSKAVDVEIASYYILARIELEQKESTDKIFPVIRWLAKQRNSNGGFVSTQDTVVALEALAKYASFQSDETMDMGLVVEADGLVKGFKLNEDNKVVTQKVQIPELPTVVDLQAVGEGCALIQFSFRYNVQSVTGSDAFDFNSDVTKTGSSNCNFPRISVCMRYKIPEQTSNMVVVSIKMVSGYIPVEESLETLQQDTRAALKRYEVDENEVNLYFDELTNEQRCFMFFVENEMQVEDVKPATIKIYDYYQPELHIVKDYVIPSICSAVGLPVLPTLPPLFPDIDSSTIETTSGTTQTDDHWKTATTLSDDDHSTAERIESDNHFKTTTILPESTHLYNEYHTELSSEIPYAVDNTTTTDYYAEITETSESGSSLDPEITSTVSKTMETNADPHESEPTTNLEISETNIDSETETVEIDETNTSFENTLTSTTSKEIETTLVPLTSTASIEVAETDTTSVMDTSEYITTEHTSGMEDNNDTDEVLADDSFGINENSERFSNFVDLEHELDFPDGLEGNIPTFVLPDTNDTTEDMNSSSCPICSDEFPDDFNDVYCASSFAIQVLIQDVGSRSIKILQDFSPIHTQPKLIKKLATLLYNSTCNCPQLQKEGDTVMITGADKSLWKLEKGNHKIRLATGSHVISTSIKLTELTVIKRDACTDDP